MRVAFYTNSASPHQLPLAREIASLLGEGNFLYVYRDAPTEARRRIGWGRDLPEWCVKGTEDDAALMEADVIYTGGLRPLDLIRRRIGAGKATLYYTERWFKPLRIMGLNLPGGWRMAVPPYRRMAQRMVEMLNNPLCRCLAIGPWAKGDMIGLGVKPGQIADWGYFVESGLLNAETQRSRGADEVLKVLWVGRLLKLKRVDTIIRAVGELSTRSTCSTRPNVILEIHGAGPEEKRLKKMASKYGDVIKFHPYVPIDEVRSLMQRHDVYVLASDSNEGWGAVVNEALEEGMKVLGTHEAGACEAMLGESDLFHAGDWRRLAGMLKRCAMENHEGALKGQGIGDWTPRSAADRLLGLCGCLRAAYS